MDKENKISNILIGILYFILGVVLIAATNELIKTFNYILVSISAIIGVVGMIIALVNYPIYKGILTSRKNKYADKILALSNKILSEEEKA